ncbi:MAG: hypothetical protein RL237_775, partial [Actinomycetota bacterium]
ISLSLSLLNFFGCNQKNPFSAIFSGAHFANHRYLIIDPQAIIIGGGVVDAGELFLAPVRAAMRKYMPFAESHVPPKIIAAKFGNDAGLIGAADLVRA